MNLTSIFSKINKLSLYLLLFLTPIIFLPFSQNVLDFPKQNLTLILIGFSLISWLGKQIFSGELLLRKNKLFYLSLFLILIVFSFSLVFVSNIQISFFGSPSTVSDSFLTIFLFLILVFLLINSFEKKSEFLPSIFLILLAGAIAGLFNIFQIFKIHLFPFDFTRNLTFNTVGTPNVLAIFETILLPLCLILFLKSQGFLKLFLGVIFILLFLNILFVNFKTAWLILIIEILILFIFYFDRAEKIKISFIFLSMVILILAIFFYFFPSSLLNFPSLPPEISLSLPAEIYIIKNAFSDNLKNLFFGTGPGTFVFDYSLYRSPDLNRTVFWGTRFFNGYSLFLDWLLTKGILGGIALIFLYFLILISIFKQIKNLQKKDDFYEIKLGISCGLLGLIFVSFLYPFNFSLNFLFWLFLGSFLFFNNNLIKINLSSPSQLILMNSIFIIVVILVFGAIFIQGQRYLADINYMKGLKAFESGSLNEAIDFLQKATNFNPSLDIYWRDLSQLYLTKANNISQDQNLTTEEKLKLVNLAIVNGGEAINKAVKLGPNNVANWNVRGFFYRNLIGIQNAEEVALSSYQKAIQLEPNSPYAYGEKARVYILLAQNFAQRGDKEHQKENLNLALENLNKAIQLKLDYAIAHYLLAVCYDQLGAIDQAISKLEETKIITPQDWGIAFQLGLLYWRKGEIEKSKNEFERAINLNPDYLNARYMLGLIYDKLGEKNKAKIEFEKILNSNPQNKEIEKILENINKGLPALEGVITSQPPIQENPSEIKK